VAIKLSQSSRIVGTALALTGTCLCCAVAIVHFYGLHGAATLWPYKSQFEQNLVIIRTALIATLVSSWAVWFGARRKHNFVPVMLRTGLATLVTLALYGFAGCGGVLGGDYHNAIGGLLSDLIFPSTFFAEFNFLTFIFQVAPVVAIAEGILLYFALRCSELTAASLDQRN
jgi:hypothetical protein